MLIAVLFLLIISTHLSWSQYDLSNVIPGTKMSINDDMFVSASNAFSNFAVVMNPFRNASTGGPIRCNMRFNTTDRFVHSVAVAGVAKNSTDSGTFLFVFAAEKISTKTPYVCIGTIVRATCANRVQCTDMAAAGSHQDYFLIGIDANGTSAYGFTSSFVFKLDIYTNKIILNLTTDSVWPSSGFVPHSMDVSDTWAVVAGYGYPDVVKKIYAALGCLINLSILTNSSCTALTSETTFLVPSDVELYSEIYEMSVAIRGRKVLVGVPRLSSVVVLQNLGPSLNASHVYSLSYPDASSVGRVVDWADDTTIAVLVQNPTETSWSKSQVFFYDENSVSLTSPIFTFPNNQQILGARLLTPSFARFGITSGKNMALLTDKADILIVPTAPAGYASKWIDTTERVFVFYYQAKLCIGGTYKNLSSLGPCQICPPHTRNPGTLPDGIKECIPCSSSSLTSFCPLASLFDIDLDTVRSYSQAMAYPETGDIADVEDLLIENMFQINSARRCLLISPLLWTLVMSGLCLFILILMVLIKQCGFKQCVKCRKRAKNIFKHTDIIGEGEMWAGGLATTAILVLVSFSYWFSASFVGRYPIEKITGPATFSCDQSLINAQFSTGLDLLSLPKSEEAQPIFDLLDGQTFHLTIELINTGFMCQNITTQENLIGTKYVPLSTVCIQSVSDATTSVTFPLPRHQTTIQYNMTGPHWIGGIRLCIRGEGYTNISSTLRELDTCQFYYTPNEAIGRITDVPIVFIKNINRTQALNVADATLYSGLWMPTFSTVSLSDEAYYVEFGNYLRYTSSMTVIQVTFDERPFFIKNIQQPIARATQLIFHGLLFTSLCIELFAFTFLLIKLFIVPIFRLGGRLWHKCRGHDDKSDGSNNSREASLSHKHLHNESSIWNVDVNQAKTHKSDSTLSTQIQGEDQRRCSATEIELTTDQLVCRL